jgi:hypothetical protein
MESIEGEDRKSRRVLPAGASAGFENYRDFHIFGFCRMFVLYADVNRSF